MIGIRKRGRGGVYFSWGLAYGKWFDIGVYSITVLLIGFGLVGIFLYSVMDEEEE